MHTCFQNRHFTPRSQQALQRLSNKEPPASTPTTLQILASSVVLLEYVKLFWVASEPLLVVTFSATSLSLENHRQVPFPLEHKLPPRKSTNQSETLECDADISLQDPKLAQTLALSLLCRLTLPLTARRSSTACEVMVLAAQIAHRSTFGSVGAWS